MRAPVLLALVALVLALGALAAGLLWMRPQGGPAAVAEAPREDSGEIGRPPRELARQATDAPTRADAAEVEGASPADALEVLVVGVEGEPQAGIPVTLLVRAFEGTLHPLRVERTGADGLARIEEVPRLCAEARIRGGLPLPRDVALHFEVAALLPVQQEFSVPIDPQQLPEEPVRLVVPTWGALEVALVDSRGAPLGFAGTARLSVPGAASPRELDAVVHFGEGSARFEPVACGAPLRLRVTTLRRSVDVACEGPAAAGATARIELVPERVRTLLVARLVDAGGAQPRAGAVRAYLEDAAGNRTPLARASWESMPVQSSLALDLPAPLPLQPGRILRIERMQGRDGGQLSGWLELPQAVAAGTHLLGTAVLRPAGPLAAGSVVDGSGIGVTSATVALDDGFGPPLEVECAPDGSFAMHGSTPLGELALDVRASGFAPARFRCGTGSTGLRLSMSAGGSLSGRILPPAGVPAESLQLRLRGAEGGTAAAGVAVCGVDGAFAFARLAAGRHDLEVRAPFGSGAIARVEGLRVPDGGPCRDPRLDPIDLRGAASVIVLELAPAGPQVELHGLVDVRSRFASGASSAQQRRLSGPRVVLARGDERMDVTLSGDTFRTVLLEDLRASRRVDLLPPIELRVRVLGVGLLEEPHRLSALVSQRGGSPGGAGKLEVDAAGAALARLHAPGTHEIVLVVEDGRGAWSRPIASRTFEVLEVHGEQSLELEIAPAALRIAQDELHAAARVRRSRAPDLPGY